MVAVDLMEKEPGKEGCGKGERDRDGDIVFDCTTTLGFASGFDSATFTSPAGTGEAGLEAVPASRRLAIYVLGSVAVASFMRQTSTKRFLLLASRKRNS